MTVILNTFLINTFLLLTYLFCQTPSSVILPLGFHNQGTRMAGKHREQYRRVFREVQSKIQQDTAALKNDKNLKKLSVPGVRILTAD